MIGSWNWSARAVERILAGQVLTLVDVGSAGGVEPRWRPIARLTHYVGFEPDARSHAETEVESGRFASYRLIPAAVWSHDGQLLIHLCRKPRCSSHFPPRADFVGRFPSPERLDVVDRIEVAAKRLDTLGIAQADFVKMDIQGGELAALGGAERLLSSVLGLELEAEFVPIYQGQPLFGEVTEFVSRQGFEFIDFTRFGRWERDARSELGQCVFADALFLRSPERVRQTFDEGAVDVAGLRRYLAILVLYQRADLLAACRTLFADVLRREPALARSLGRVLAATQRRLFLARTFSRLAGLAVRSFGHAFRVHLQY
jgi:FkbM family methyltransferase